MQCRFAAFLICFCSGLWAQERTETKLINSQLAEETQARVYFKGNNFVAALPLYEHLAQEVPQSMEFAEALAFCLMSKADVEMQPGEERDAVLKRVKSEAERARALGDKSDLLNIIFDRLSSGAPPPNLAGKMKDAEAAFTKGDAAGALKLYEEIANEDPTSYDARLFAGDMYFRKHDAKKAGEWFQKAIQVDPDRETAYRYWGDALYQDGEQEEALKKFIDAVVAEPYNNRSAAGLRQWADRTGALLKGPNVQLPKAPEATPGGKEGDMTITLDPAMLENKKTGAAWMVYPMTRALWRSEKFAKEFPKEKKYRHSLAEEVDALKTVLSVANESSRKKIDPSLLDLVQIGKDGMLEAFVLLTIADNGIAQDYGAYRSQHRDVLHAYIEKYIVHKKP